MVTPRTRRTATKEKPEVVTDNDGDVITNVRETITDGENTKELEYAAKLKDVKGETSNGQDFSEEPETSDFDFENNFEKEVFEEIPKSKLDKMFDNLLEADPQGYQSFYAQIVRLPDAMSDNFAIRSQSQMPLGTQIFSIRDRFIFIPAIQKLNGNSGGRFNILVLDENGREVSLERTYNFNTSYHTIGIANLVIPNPIIENKQESNNQQNNNSNDDKLLAFMQQSENRFNLLLEKMNQKPEQSDIERQIMQAALNKLLNPEPQQQNSTEKIIENALSGAAAVGAIGDAFAKSINRELPQPAEKTWLEQANELGNSPLGEKLTNGIFNLAAIVASKNMNAPVIQNDNNKAPTPQGVANYPHPLNEAPPQAETGEEKSLLDLILDELEGTNEINHSNKTIKQLTLQFPNESAQIKELCKGLDFNSVVALIKMQAPDIFADYMEVKIINEKPEEVLSELGQYVMKRFEVFYNFVREQE